MYLPQSLSFSLSQFLPIVTSCSLTLTEWLWGRVGKLRLSLGGCDYRVKEVMILPQHAFTVDSAHQVSRTFNHRSTCVSVRVLVVFVQRWFENLRFNSRMLSVKFGKAFLCIPGLFCAKILADSNLFLRCHCGSIRSLIWKASAVTNKIARCESGFQ